MRNLQASRFADPGAMVLYGLAKTGVIRRAMRYDIEADWKLIDSCNYRCSYCFFTAESLGRKVAGLPAPGDWVAALKRTGLSWLLHISGGEPTLYPGFADLCVALAEDHYLSLNTNLSQPSIRCFAEAVNPSRISLIHAAIHPEQRVRRQGWAVFRDNLEHLAAHQAAVMVSVVATPAVLEIFGEIVRDLEPSGFRPVPKMLRGPFEGQNFPAAYTSVDRARFREASIWAREGYRELEAAVEEQPTIWPLYDNEMLNELPRYRGHDCEAGQKFVAIQPDGTVNRCSSDTTLGNILDDSLRLNTRPTPCDTTYCSYFCNKYTRRSYFDFGAINSKTRLV